MSWVPRIALIAAVALALALVYQQVSEYGFLSWDDTWHIRDNKYLHTLIPEHLYWMLVNADIDYWRPISFLSHGLDFALFGDWGGGHHLISVLLHGINALLVAVLAAHCVRLLVPGVSVIWVSALAALVFAVHPQHVESTAWLAERKGLLCSGFYLAAIYAYLMGRAAQSPLTPTVHPQQHQCLSRYWLRWSLVLFLLAMFSKPMAVSLPLVLMALDVYPLRRLRWGMPFTEVVGVVWRKWPYLLLAALLALFTYVVVADAGYITSGDELSSAERLINASRSALLYPWRWLAPLGLSPLYPFSAIDNSVSGLNLLPGMLLLAVALLAFYWFVRGSPQLLAVCVIYAAMVGPVLGLVHTGHQSAADRYAYLPGALWSVILAVLVARLWQRCTLVRVRCGLCLLAVLWLAGLGVMAERQVGVWRNDKTMWFTVSQYFPAWVPNPDLSKGMTLFKAGQYQAAIAPLEKAIAKRQRRFDAHLYLGLSLQQLGDTKGAEQHLRQGIALVPDSISHLRQAVRGHLGGGRYGLARQLIMRVHGLAPRLREPLRQLAIVHFESGNAQVARRVLNTLVAQDANDAQSLVLFGIMARLEGELEVASEYYQRALAVDPDNTDAASNLREVTAALAR